VGNVNYTTVENALKRDYLPELQKQIEKKVKTWDLLSKSSEGIKGRDLYINRFPRVSDLRLPKLPFPRREALAMLNPRSLSRETTPRFSLTPCWKAKATP